MPPAVLREVWAQQAPQRVYMEAIGVYVHHQPKYISQSQTVQRLIRMSDVQTSFSITEPF